jgi:chromosome segregation ATPase
MISGRDALAQLERAISQTRQDEARLDDQLAEATQTAERLRGEQATAFRRLAEVRLDALTKGAVGQRLDRAESEALAMLAEKRKALAELAARRKAAAAKLAGAQDARREVAGRLEEVSERIRSLDTKTRATLPKDAAWVAASARVKEAEATAARAEAKAKQAEEDRVAKGEPFESDRLFMYLWETGFGTSRYAASVFTRYFDRKVARLIGFVEARPNYAMLTEIPVRLAAHAARLREEVEARVAERTAIERRALEAEGIGALEAEFATVKAEIDAGNAGIAATQSDLTTLDASHDALVGGEDPALGRALDGVAASLAATDLQKLYADAFATPTPEDEKIVRRIEEIGKGVARAAHDVETARAAMGEVARRRSELEQTRDRFQRSGYDRPGVTFNNENMLGNVIGGIIGGLISSPELWRVILGGYQAPRHQDGDWIGGGPRIPGGGDWFGGGSGGGWSGGGGGGSSGGFGGGGGFSTGGGFGGEGGGSSDGGF